MSLRAKFSLLLAVMGLAIIAIVVTAVGAFTFTANTLETPFREAVQSLAALDELELALRDREGALGPAQSRQASMQERRAALDQSAERARAAVASLQSLQRDSRGASLADAAAQPADLASKVDQLFARSREALAEGAGAPPSQPALARLEVELAAYIQRMRQRVASNADAADDLAAALQRWLLAALLLEVFAAGIVAYLVLRFLNKWIVRPVNQLRVAAERIGAGDFAHRVPVAGDDEVAQLGQEVNQMAGLVSRMQEERAKQARLAALGEMSRAIAHNIRNPLAGIRALAELTRAEVNGERELAAYQSRIVDTVDRFDGWLQAMIRASEPAVGRGLREESVKQWLSGVMEARRAAADAADVRIDLDLERAPARAAFDADWLEHAVEALLTNAIEVTPPGGRVRCAAIAAEGGSSWRLRVEDEGPGVPEDVREQVFEHGFTTKPAGSGVGLALALQIVRAHGGSIAVENPGGAGSTRGAAFTITLPCLPRVSEEESGGESTEPPRDGSRARH